MVRMSRAPRGRLGALLCKISLSHILVTFLLCSFSFYLGALSGLRSRPVDCSRNVNANANANAKSDASILRDAEAEKLKIDSIVEQRLQAELDKLDNANSEKITRFNDKVAGFAYGMARVDKDEFVRTFDYGIPADPGKGTKAADVLLIYNENSLPSSPNQTAALRYQTQDGIPSLSIPDATQNCEILSVVTTQVADKQKKCLAIVGNYESYHVQKWMRLGSTNGQLRPVSRGNDLNGRINFKPPSPQDMDKHWSMLRTYFNTIDDVLEELKPIAKKVAVDNTIVVLTCNMGQSELLMNFVCSSRARGFNLDNVLVFPTDVETKELAEGLGLTTFYNEKHFGHIPQQEAGRYGDRFFVAMMYAKVVSVQLINKLGYDLLFQDVDVVWYKNPLDYFKNINAGDDEFDMYFQDDGAHSIRYAPYSANSGFYFVRSNRKTQYAFTSLLYAGDIIMESDSHQQALVQILVEHASLFGLRVKVLNRNDDEFPGGFHYHRKRDLMKRLLKTDIPNRTSYIFHMSWTNNKVNKLKFFQQMGEWYLRESCISKKYLEIMDDAGETERSVPPLMGPCCMAEPEVTCHFRDKPSIIPCRGSDPIDRGRPSFW